MNQLTACGDKMNPIPKFLQESRVVNHPIHGEIEVCTFNVETSTYACKKTNNDAVAVFVGSGEMVELAPIIGDLVHA